MGNPQPSNGILARSPRLGVLAGIYWKGILAVALGSLLSIAALEWGIRGVMEEQHEDASAEVAARFEREFARTNQDLAAIGSWLIKQPDLIALVRTRDSEGLKRAVAPAGKLSGADLIIVTDRDGTALVRLWSENHPSAGDSRPEAPGVKEALAGTESQYVGQDHLGRLQWQRAFSVHDLASSPPIGALVIGFHLSSAFLRNASAGTDAEIAIVHNGQIAVTTLADSPGVASAGRAVATANATSDSGDRFGAPITLATDGRVYDFRFKSLKVPGASTPLLYGVGTPHTELIAIPGMLWQVIAVQTISGLAILALAGYAVAHWLVQPIRTLDITAQAMASGDLSTPIAVQRRDELGELASHLEAVRQHLAQSLQVVTKEKNRIAASVRSMGAAAIITDENGRVSAVNHAAEALLKQDQERLLGLPWHHVFVANDDRDDSSGSFWAVGPSNANGEARLIVRGRFPLRDRPYTVLDVLSSPLEVEGVSTGYVHILQDASALEQLTRAKDELVLNLAHELRAPLASLRTSIDLVMEDYAAMSKHDLGVMLRTLRRSIVKFQNLVETLVDVGRLQSGHFRVQPTKVDFNRVLQDAVGQVEPTLQARNQTLDLNFRCPANCQVLADRPRIIQVIINLLSNASKYGPENEPIAMSVYLDSGRVYVEVTDNGLGIAPEEQAQLFQRFYRTKRAEQEGAGIGLGLALSKGIVEAHGGQIGLRSQPGSGTTFWFSLQTVEPSNG